MKVYTNVEYIWDDSQGKLVELSSESHEYSGDVARCDIIDFGESWDIDAPVGEWISQMPTYTSYWNQMPQDILTELMAIFGDYYQPSDTQPGNTTYPGWQAGNWPIYADPDNPLWENVGLPGYQQTIDPSNPQGGMGSSPGADAMNVLLPWTNLFDPTSIARSLTEGEDIQEASARIAPQRALDMSLIERLGGEYYKPLVYGQQHGLTQELMGRRGEAEKAGRGFDVYGGRERQLGGAQSKYYRGMSDVLSSVDKQRATARQGISDILQSWRRARMEA